MQRYRVTRGEDLILECDEVRIFAAKREGGGIRAVPIPAEIRRLCEQRRADSWIAQGSTGALKACRTLNEALESPYDPDYPVPGHITGRARSTAAPREEDAEP